MVQYAKNLYLVNEEGMCIIITWFKYVRMYKIDVSPVGLRATHLF